MISQRCPHGSAGYLFVRQGDDATLEVIDAGMAEEFVAEGEPLSDHPALFVHLRVTLRAP